MTNLRSKSVLAVAFLAAVAAPLMLGAPAASARVNVGIDVGIPGFVAPVYAPPPVVYAAPAPVYAAPPVYVAPGPVVAVGGYWGHDHWGHRHWYHRR